MSSQVVTVAQLDDNPYDGISSATNLNSRLWQSPGGDGQDLNTNKGDTPNDRIMAGLMGAAVETPNAKQSVGDAADNSLPTGDGLLPDRPSVASVRESMNGVAAAVRRCGLKDEDRIVLRLVVSGDTGRVVKSSAVDSGHRGTSAGLCAARAARLAKFPPFSKENVSIKYPFDL